MRIKEEGDSIKGLEKGLKILFLLTEHNTSLNIAFISRRLSLPRSTTYRYINTLKKWGLIEEDAKRGYYRLGKGLLELSAPLRRSLDYVDIAYPIMEELHRETGESIVLAAIYGYKAIWVEKIDSHHTLRISCDPGTTQYLHAGASAKVILAYLDEHKQEEIVKTIGLPKLTDKTITQWEILKEDLKNIRSKGIAVSNSEVDPGVVAIAAPLFDHKGQIWGSLSVVGPEQRLGPQAQALIAEKVKESAQKINEAVQKYGIQPFRRGEVVKQ